MYKAELSLTMLFIAGVWRPITWTLFFTVNLYNTFTAFAILLVYTFDISLFMYLILHSLNDIDEFAESLCWFLALFVSSVKMTNLLLRRNDIIDLTQFLIKDCFQPRNSFEKIMQDNRDYIAWSVIKPDGY